MRRGRMLIATLSLLLALPFTVLADTFTHRETGEVVEGQKLGIAGKDGEDYFLVKVGEETRRMLPTAQWEHKEAPHPSQEAPTTGQKPAAAKAEGRVMEVLATGVGLDQEQARQNAFSNAIEQVVGVLVDAETLVKNDEIVRDEVLTYSRGYIQRFDVLKEWQEGGMHHARIRALVSVDKMTERLTARNVPVRDVPGELLYRQIIFDIRNEEEAIAILRKTLAEYYLPRFFRAELLGKPEVTERDKTHASLRIRVRVTPDFAAWDKFRPSLVAVLDRLAKKRVAFRAGYKRNPFRRTSKRNRAWNAPPDSTLRISEANYLQPASPYEESKIRSLETDGEKGVKVHLWPAGFRERRAHQVDAFLLPTHLQETFDEVRDQYGLKIRAALVGPDGAILGETEQELRWSNPGIVWYPGYGRGNDYYWLGPLLFGEPRPGGQVKFSDAGEWDLAFRIQLERLRDVKKCDVSLTGKRLTLPEDAPPGPLEKQLLPPPDGPLGPSHPAPPHAPPSAPPGAPPQVPRPR